MARVAFDHVRLDYPIYSSVSRSLRAHVVQSLGGEIAPDQRTAVVRALEDISFELKDGDRLGVVGHNGAGKTTMLRVISGVYKPTCGTVSIDGSVSALTDITLGMDHEATGWDNIVMRSVFLGMTFKEARMRSKEIAEFTELGQFLELPVRTYSTGMYVRLAFAISTAVTPDILVMDEMIGAGDAAFLAKAQQRIGELIGRIRILVLASHYPHVISAFTNRVVWLDKGHIREFGPTEEVMAKFAASAAAAPA